MHVVTGAAGFIGSHLVERLLSSDQPVVGLDSFDDYYPRELKEGNLAEARRDPRFRFLEADLTDCDLATVLHEGDTVIHLAGQPGVRGSWGPQFDRYVRNNLLATQRLLEAAVKARVGRVVYGGSSSVYGQQSTQPTDETALPRPMSPYGVTKLAAEHLVHLYGALHQFPTVALRFFTVYGPRQRPDMAFPKFFQAIHRGEPISLYGEGRWSRDFTYVDDIVGGIVAAASRAAPGGTYNLAGGAPTGLIEVVQEMSKVVGREPQIRFASDPGGEPSSTWADCRRAEEVLGYRPVIGLREGLQRQWEWQRRALPT